MSNQHDQDRDRIAEAMGWRRETWAGHGMTYTWAKTTRVGDIDRRVVHPIVNTLDAAIAAFETLCEPKGFDLEWRRTSLGPRYWIASRRGSPIAPSVESTGNHAADVCRLVCEVLDREANP